MKSSEIAVEITFKVSFVPFDNLSQFTIFLFSPANTFPDPSLSFLARNLSVKYARAMVSTNYAHKLKRIRFMPSMN